MIRNGISEFCPHLGQGFSEELEKASVDWSGELVKGGVLAIVGDRVGPDTPKSLNRVEMRCVGRQKVQLHTTVGACKAWREDPGLMITRVVENDVKLPSLWGCFTPPFDNFPGCFCMDLLASTKQVGIGLAPMHAARTFRQRTPRFR